LAGKALMSDIPAAARIVFVLMWLLVFLVMLAGPRYLLDQSKRVGRQTFQHLVSESPLLEDIHFRHTLIPYHTLDQLCKMLIYTLVFLYQGWQALKAKQKALIGQMPVIRQMYNRLKDDLRVQFALLRKFGLLYVLRFHVYRFSVRRKISILLTHSHPESPQARFNTRIT
jgi:hypothetical protein